MAVGGKTTKEVCSSCLTGEVLLIPACQSQRHQHRFCVDCMLNCVRSRVGQEQHLGLSCPWNDDCHSSMDKKLLKDIVHQLQTVHKRERGLLSKHLDKLAEISLIESVRRVPCPNEECTHPFVIDRETWAELFSTCPQCNKQFCITCKHSLGSNGYRGHVCASESSRTTLQVMKRELAEILTQCVLLSCPNKTCEMFSARAPLVKEEGDCNTMQCRGCERYYCYICNKDLGSDKFRAHLLFPHTNEACPGAPDCWLFNEDALEKTEYRARHLRKLQGVTNFLQRLPNTNEEKNIYLEECKDILGFELYEELQKIMAKCKTNKNKRCVIM